MQTTSCIVLSTRATVASISVKNQFLKFDALRRSKRGAAGKEFLHSVVLRGSKESIRAKLLNEDGCFVYLLAPLCRQSVESFAHGFADSLPISGNGAKARPIRLDRFTMY